ncbi:MAG: ABC-type spermidine/putrescine transport system, ATPase component [Chlorobi bacterium]|nr:ABC-type spermidine/putrescine transport system, ATPase component [Chlorobiota bacterium]
MVLTVSNIDKAYGGHPVLNDVGLAVDERETLAILGRSGCGKTTLLKIIAGLVDPDRGELRLRENAINDLPVARRNIVYIYQEALLFPHLDIFENIAFGLRLRKIPEATIRERVEEMLGSLELSTHARRMPHQLSGGERQRVAFGRAMIVNPSVLLLDEPFSNLDAETRAAMQGLFQRLAAHYGIASIVVTHDLKEAILLGDRISYMRDGRLLHFSSKSEFIAHPEYGARREMDFWRSLGDQINERE